MPMPVLTSTAVPRSAEFKKNAEAMRAVIGDLRAQVARVELGGGERARQRHLSRGKLLPRDRVRELLEPGSPFLELSQLAEHGLSGDEVPSTEEHTDETQV